MDSLVKEAKHNNSLKNHDIDILNQHLFRHFVDFEKTNENQIDQEIKEKIHEIDQIKK